MTYPTPPLSDAQRDALIRAMTSELNEAAETISELRAELVAVHAENAALKAGRLPENPFVG